MTRDGPTPELIDTHSAAFEKFVLDALRADLRMVSDSERSWIADCSQSSSTPATGWRLSRPVDANGNKVPFKPQAVIEESLKQQKRIAELEGTVARLAAMVKEQAAQIQKVSAQLEASKPAPKVVANR